MYDEYLTGRELDTPNLDPRLLAVYEQWMVETGATPKIEVEKPVEPVKDREQR